MKQAELMKLTEGKEEAKQSLDHAVHHLRKLNQTKWNDKTEREMLCLIYNTIKGLDAKI